MRTQGEHYVACTEKTINAHTTLVKKPDGTTPLRRIRYWWDENNKMALKQWGWEVWTGQMAWWWSLWEWSAEPSFSKQREVPWL